MNKKVIAAQTYLQEKKLDGWLLYDFHRNNDLAHRFLEIPPSKMVTRRFFYWIPARGTPVRIVHAIEAEILDAWPGEKRIFSTWQSLEKEVERLLKGCQRIAMEYSPKNGIPYVSKVDGGTLDLIRSFGVEVASSADFLLHFTSVLTEEQLKSQQRAAHAMQEIVEGAWELIAKALKGGKSISEGDVQAHILQEFRTRKLVTESAPIVAVNAHSADPHFATAKIGSSQIQTGDFILIDLWAKEEGSKSIFGDITRVAVADVQGSPKQEEVFRVVRNGQKAGIALIRERFAAKKTIQGWEVDEAVRTVIQKAGYGEYFIHRTGHSIDMELHGSGTHMDNLEMHDVRPILPMTCFSIEPGIYLPGEFGLRLESDVLIHRDGTVEVTGGEQETLRRLLD
ncbi:MAG TPA: M24 family metallopeptidase [Chlamydiales bacterium]|jgi:Xaa-Pro aminopeptidase|nr:M24 family metallopeptidase [Chlamydiales bacterium]